MNSDIHRKLIKKMLIGSLILSVIIGGIVAFAEIERIDRYVVDLAQADSAALTEAYHRFFHGPDAANRTALSDLAARSLNRSHFALVEIYGRYKEKIVENALPHIGPLLHVLEGTRHTFLMNETVDYIRIWHDRRLYLKIVAPIFDAGDTSSIIGYFEGIYQVPPDKMKEIGLWLIGSVAQTVIAILLTAVILYPVIISLNKDLIQRSTDLSAANLGMLKVLGGAVAKRDSDTHAHNFRVTIYAIRLAERLGLGRKDIRALIKGAFLHDVGKIGISDTILLKPGKLTDEEFRIMKQHVTHGVDIIRHYAWLDDAVDVVRCHHEKFDGTGYMEGLRGKEIPVNARVFAIADVFDALTSERPYKKAFSFERSVDIIGKGAGNHFDPEMAKAFLEIARPLYDALGGREDDEELGALLGRLTGKYFRESRERNL